MCQTRHQSQARQGKSSVNTFAAQDLSSQRVFAVSATCDIGEIMLAPTVNVAVSCMQPTSASSATTENTSESYDVSTEITSSAKLTG